jgi:hypothetical protein
MSNFTQRLYRDWLRANGGNGGLPHGQRLEGYPIDQRRPVTPTWWGRPARPMPSKPVTSRESTPRAPDAASRPEKQPAARQSGYFVTET